MSKMNWAEAEEHMKNTANMYKTLPYQSAWFVIKQLEQMHERYMAGERTQQLYDEIMSLE